MLGETLVRYAAVILAGALLLIGCGDAPKSDATSAGATSVEDVTAFFKDQGKSVLTFVGYSGSGYEDEAGMLAEAGKVLARHDPKKTLVNIGVTPDGIGAVYTLAKTRGFTTTGIVSTQAKKYEAATSSDADHVFFVADETWGGFVEGSERLSPTSEAMVAVSDVLVGIGGGAVGRDEMIAAKSRGKSVTFIPADMNHARAIDKAKRKGKPVPTGFRGAAHAVFVRP